MDNTPLIFTDCYLHFSHELFARGSVRSIQRASASGQARSEGVAVGGSFHGIVLPRLPAAPYDLIARQQRTIADNRYAVYEMVPEDDGKEYNSR